MLKKLSHTFQHPTSGGGGVHSTTTTTTTKSDHHSTTPKHTASSAINRFVDRKLHAYRENKEKNSQAPNPVDPSKTITLVGGENESDAEQQQQQQQPTAVVDMNTYVHNPENRALFKSYLRKVENGYDQLLVFYLLISSFDNRDNMNTDKIRQFLTKTLGYYEKNQIETMLTPKVSQQVNETLRKCVYNEIVFKTAKAEIRSKLEPSYLQFIASQSNANNTTITNTTTTTTATRPPTGITTSNNTSRHTNERGPSMNMTAFHKEKPTNNTKSSSQSASNRLNRTSLNHLTQSEQRSNHLNESRSSLKTTLGFFPHNTTTTTTTGTASGSSTTVTMVPKPTTSSSSASTSATMTMMMMPPHPYSVPTRPVTSCQDSELQSMVSGSGVGDFAGADMTYYPIPKKNNFLFNRHQMKQHYHQQLPLDMSQLSLGDVKNTTQMHITQMDMTTTTTTAATMINQHSERQAKMALYEQAQKRPAEFAQVIMGELEALIARHGHKVTYDEDAENKPLIPLPIHNNKLLPAAANTPPITTTNIAVGDNQQHQQFYYIDGPHDSLTSNVNPHYRYKTTFKSVERDIDSQAYGSNNPQTSHHHHHHHGHHHSAKPGASIDSGFATIATKSNDSMERVNDWLNNGKSQQQTAVDADETASRNNDVDKTFRMKNVNEKKRAPIAPGNNNNNNNNNNTSNSNEISVAYYMPGEDLPYITKVRSESESITLAEFKQKMIKKGDYRYFFKTISDVLGEETVVLEEVTDDRQVVPVLKGKVIAKVEHAVCS